MLSFDVLFEIDERLNTEFDAGDNLAAEFAEHPHLDAEVDNLMLVHTGGGGELLPATRTRLGGIIVGSNLNVTDDGTLSVDMASDIEKDNTRPISSAHVYTSIGNINALLGAI